MIYDISICISYVTFLAPIHDSMVRLDPQIIHIIMMEACEIVCISRKYSTFQVAVMLGMDFNFSFNMDKNGRKNNEFR